MRVYLGQTEITEKVRKDDILYTSKSLDESFDFDEILAIRIEDTDGSIETMLLNQAPQLVFKDDSDNEIARYYFDGFYERVENGRFVDAKFRRRLIASQTVGNRVGFFSANLLASRVFGTAYTEEFFEIPSNFGAVLNGYDTLLSSPDWTTLDTLYDPTTNRQFVAVGNKLVVFDWTTNTKTEYTFSTPVGRSNTRTVVSGQPRNCFLRLIGFSVVGDTKYLFFVRDDVVYNVSGQEFGYFSLLRVPTNFYYTGQVEEIAYAVFKKESILYFTEALKQDPSAIIPLRDSSGNAYGFFFVTLRKDSTYGTIYILYSDLLGVASVAKTYTNLDLSNVNQHLFSRKSDCVMMDGNNYALVWRGFFFVRRTGNEWYYTRAYANSSQAAVMYSDGYFKAVFQNADTNTWKEVWFSTANNTFQTIGESPAYGLAGGNVWVYNTVGTSYFRSGNAIITIPNTLDAIKEISYNNNFLAYRIAHQDTEYIVVGKKENQAILTVFVNADEDYFDVVRDAKKLFRDSIFFHPTEKRLVFSSNIPLVGTISQEEHKQTREQAEALRTKYLKIVFADSWYLIRGMTSEFLEELRLDHIVSTFGRILGLIIQNFRTYEFVSANSYEVGKKYTYTDEEGRTNTILIIRKQRDFDDLNHYEGVTTEFSTAIDFDFEEDQPSWLVLDYEFSCANIKHGTNFEYDIFLSYTSQGRENPTKIYWQVVDTISDVLVDEGWSWVSGRNVRYTIRFFRPRLSNFLVTVRLESPHASETLNYTIQNLAPAEPQKAAPLVEVLEGETEALFENPNAYFMQGLDYWDADGFIVAENYHARVGILYGNTALGIRDGCRIATQKMPFRGYYLFKKYIKIAGCFRLDDVYWTDTILNITLEMYTQKEDTTPFYTQTIQYTIDGIDYDVHIIPIESGSWFSYTNYYRFVLEFHNPHINEYNPLPLRMIGIYSPIPGEAVEGIVPHAGNASTLLGRSPSAFPRPDSVVLSRDDGKISLGWIPQGEGSTLNADQLDGYHARDFMLASNLKVPVITGNLPNPTANDIGKMVIRLWEDGSYQYCDLCVCVQTGPETYSWVLLSRKQWLLR